MPEPLDLEAIRAELRNAAHLEKRAESPAGELASHLVTMAWVSLGRHVPRLVETVELLFRQHAILEHRYEDRAEELARERAAVARVRALHQQYRTAWTDEYDVCSHCSRGTDLVRWPCDTVQALDGDQPPPTTCGRPGCYGSGPGYEVRANTERCKQCEQTGAEQ